MDPLQDLKKDQLDTDWSVVRYKNDLEWGSQFQLHSKLHVSLVLYNRELLLTDETCVYGCMQTMGDGGRENCCFICLKANNKTGKITSVSVSAHLQQLKQSLLHCLCSWMLSEQSSSLRANNWCLSSEKRDFQVRPSAVFHPFQLHMWAWQFFWPVAGKSGSKDWVNVILWHDCLHLG